MQHAVQEIAVLPGHDPSLAEQPYGHRPAATPVVRLGPMAGIARLAEFEVIARDADMHRLRPFREFALLGRTEGVQLQVCQGEGDSHRE